MLVLDKNYVLMTLDLEEEANLCIKALFSKNVKKEGMGSSFSQPKTD
jgi:hypothetical protein